MQIAITGATGFLGRYLLRHACDNGHQVIAWYRSESSRPPEAPGVRWVRGELGNMDDASRLVESADAVIHSGLSKPSGSFLDTGNDPLDYWQRNTTGSLQLLHAAAQQPTVKRFLFISSGAVHDDVLAGHPLDETHPPRPKTLYGAYKAAVEALMHHFGCSGDLCTTSLRPPAIYGLADPPDQSKWFDLVRRVGLGEQVAATGGSKTVHAADVAKAALLLLNQDPSTVTGEIYNCCDRMISDFEVAEIAKQLSESSSEISGPQKVARHEIITNKIESLGMEFGGQDLLRQTIGQLVAAVRPDSQRPDSQRPDSKMTERGRVPRGGSE